MASPPIPPPPSAAPRNPAAAQGGDQVNPLVAEALIRGGSALGPNDVLDVNDGYIPPGEVLEGVIPTMVDREIIEGISDLPAYDIMNGDPTHVEPYLQRSTVANYYKWVPVGNVPAARSLESVDAFIKSHLYHLNLTAPDGWSDTKKRMTAIMLGASRAVMHANYRLGATTLIPGETTLPTMNASWNAGQEARYSVIAPAPATGTADGRAVLRTPLALSDVEKDRMKAVVKMAMAIVPIQGLNLITEGHHYISEPSKASFRAFLAIENQVLVSTALKDWWETDLDHNRDTLWHKAGHPILVELKKAAATSPQVIANLNAANLGSATARLPAMESDARTASSYIKLCRTAHAVYSEFGGSVDSTLLEDAYEALSQFPFGRAGPAGGLQVAEGTTVHNRAQCVGHIQDVCRRNVEKVAVFYGFYCAMLEATTMNAGDNQRTVDTLSKAFSLKKLKKECLASYYSGHEMYKDLAAAKAKVRASGRFAPARYVLE